MAPGLGSVTSGFPMSVNGPVGLVALAAPTAYVPELALLALKYATYLVPTLWISGAQKLLLAQAGLSAAVKIVPSFFQ